MAISFHEYDKYSIKGKIINVNDSSTLTISVTSPFVSEIEFHCSSDHYDMLHPPTSKYNWISWVRDSTHPVVSEAAAYYNTNDKYFYKKESGSESEWKRTDFEDIYDDNPNLLGKSMYMQEKYQLFLYKYMSILHKEQLCHFSAYAIDTSNRKSHSISGKQVERHPDDYFWIYDPDTFQGKKWDTKSIDGLVKEIRPSRECLEQLLESYKVDDREAWVEKWKKRWQGIKSSPERFRIWIDKYDKMMIGLGGLIVGIILATFAILTYFKN